MRSTVRSAGGYEAMTWIVGKLTLPGKYGGHAVAPGFLDRGQNTQFVVHQDVVLGRVTALDVIQRLLFMDVDEHMALHRLEDAGALHLARLEDHVAV